MGSIPGQVHYTKKKILLEITLTPYFLTTTYEHTMDLVTTQSVTCIAKFFEQVSREWTIDLQHGFYIFAQDMHNNFGQVVH